MRSGNQRHDKVKRNHTPIETQILTTQNEMARLQNELGEINAAFEKRCKHHERFASVCAFTVAGWALYPFEGVAFLIDLSVVNARKSTIESKLRNLQDNLTELNSQRRVNMPVRFAGSNRLFDYAVPAYEGRQVSQLAP